MSQAAAVNALPAFFIEYYTAADGTVDSAMRGKLKIASSCYFVYVTKY